MKTERKETIFQQIIFEATALVVLRTSGTDRLCITLPPEDGETVRGEYAKVFGNDVTFSAEITKGDWKGFCWRLGLSEVEVIDAATGERWVEVLTC